MPFEAFEAGFLSILPPIIAIVLALITKEVIFSLILGILSGTMIYSFSTGLGFAGIVTVTSELMINRVGNNAEMIIFLVMLGALVAVVTKAGGSRAYGLWAARKLKSAKSASLATSFLGLILFIDDYFNCLTVGTVMRPITDKYKISREKLAYLIDTTAAPICIIAPVSSWAAAVISYYPETAGVSGMQAFISSIPMNLYALLSIFMIFWLCIRQKDDYSLMARAQARAEKGQVEPAGSEELTDDIAKMKVSEKGLVMDLIVPVLFLVVFSIIAMLYYGGFPETQGSLGSRIFEAFGDTDAGLALALGGFISLFAAFFMYVPRRLMSLKEFFSSVTVGIKSMVPALIILSLAWTIASVCRHLLLTGDYVAGLVEQSNLPVMLIPAIMFLVDCVLSFSTGTSWGTFGILIPITITICEIVAPWLSITSLSAVLAGAVFGDHCSPISDSTILSSIGAQCPHIDHVQTQIPYAVTVASVSVIGYVIAGLTSTMGYGVSVAITLSASLFLLIAALLFISRVSKNRAL